MATDYVKTLTVGGTPHDIKDEVARSAIVTLNDTKADKVSNATSGNFAGLDSNGNLTDSGSKASDFQGTLVSGTNIKTIDSNSLLGSGNVEILPYAGDLTGNIDNVVSIGFYKTRGNIGASGLLIVNSNIKVGTATIITQTRIVSGTAQYRTGTLLNNTVSTWSAWQDINGFGVIDYDDLTTATTEGVYRVWYEASEFSTTIDKYGILIVDKDTNPSATWWCRQTLIYDLTYKYRTRPPKGSWSAWADVISVPDNASQIEYTDPASNEYYVTIDESVATNLTAIDNALHDKADAIPIIDLT